MGKLAFLVSLVAVLCVGALARQSSSGGTPTVTFLGKWKLNVDKSSPGPTAGTITIEPEGKKYRITLEVAYPGGLGGTAWTVTDMTGWGSPVTRNFSQPLAEEWHVKREGVDSFTLISVFRVAGAGGRTEWRYTLSSDRKTLTRRVISGGASSQRNQVLVFDQVP